MYQQEIGETLTYDNISEVRTMMSKFSLAGIYRIDNEYKISNFNKASQVNAPTDYTEIEDIDALMMY